MGNSDFRGAVGRPITPFLVAAEGCRTAGESGPLIGRFASRRSETCKTQPHPLFNPTAKHNATMSVRYRSPLLIPAVARHTATVIFIHGLGDTGDGWTFAVQNWRLRQRLDGVKFVLPHAPNIPITVNGGFNMPGWYDIVSQGPATESMAVWLTCAGRDGQ